MKTLKISAFILAAVLFLGLGATTVMAEDAKTMTLDGKSLNMKNCKSFEACTCQKCECAKTDGKVCTCQKCECGDKAPKQAMKCGAGKCGASMNAPEKEYERGEIKTH